MPKINKKYLSLPIIVIIGFFAVSNYIFIRQSDNIVRKDVAEHIASSASMYRNLAGHSGNFRMELTKNPDWPPLYYLAGALIRLFFGFKMAFMASTLFLILLLYSTYKIGELIRDKTTGLLSALILSFYPGIYIPSRVFDMELAQAALAALTIYFLMRIERFSSLKYSMLFGILLAAGVLVKQATVFFIVGPFCAAVYYLLKPAAGNRIRLRNMLISILSGVFLAILVYYRIYFINSTHFSHYGASRLFTNNINGAHCGQCYRPDLVLFHISALKDFHIGLPGLALFLICLPYFLLKNKNTKYKIFLALWFLVPSCILAIMTARFHQYSISYLPVFAIITAAGISYIPLLPVKRWLIGIFCVLSLLPYLDFTPKTYPALLTSFTRLKAVRTLSDYLKIDWEPVFDKGSNPAYLAAEYLNEVMQGKKYRVGMVYYMRDSQRYPLYLKTLLQFYSNNYEVIDLVRDDEKIRISGCRFIVFIRHSGGSEEWPDYDTFMQDLTKMDKNDAIISLYEGNRPPPQVSNSIYLSKNRVENTIRGFFGLKLIKTISVAGREILIYENQAQAQG